MDVESTHGLTIALVDADEALRTDWAARRDGFDLVRVIDPERSHWPALRLAGFGVHPAWITWVSPVGASEEDFLARLARKERYAVRAGQRFAAEHRIRMEVGARLTAQGLDSFLELYACQIAGMRHGVPFALMERDDIIAEADGYFTVLAFAGTTLVGGCVCRKREDISTAVIRFAATTPDSRRHQLVRPMYMQVFQAARELGFDNISLGSDPALYGHMAKPGLFSFKSRLGFTPIPARLFGSIDDPDEATLVLRLDALTDPSLLLCYRPSTNGRRSEIAADTPLELDVLTRDPDIDVSSYRAPFLAGVTVRRTGEPLHRRPLSRSVERGAWSLR